MWCGAGNSGRAYCTLCPSPLKMSKRPWCGGSNHHLRRLINWPGIIIIIINPRECYWLIGWCSRGCDIFDLLIDEASPETKTLALDLTWLHQAVSRLTQRELLTENLISSFQNDSFDYTRRRLQHRPLASLTLMRTSCWLLKCLKMSSLLFCIASVFVEVGLTLSYP